MPMPMPTDSTRWRCTGCGNLTRFDVVRRAVVREFWRQDLIELVARCAPETADGTGAEQAEPGRS